MGTNSYVTKLKAQLDQAIIQRDHWKQLAENRNSIVVTEVCPESRSTEEYIIDADSVRASWRLIREYREQIEALRAENGRLSANIARLTSNPADHRYWEGRYRDSEAELEAARGLLEQRIPCDVMLPPATTIKRGCPLSTVLASMKLREDVAPNQRVFTATPAPEVQAEQGERQEVVAWETRCNTERRFSVNQCSAEERAEHWRKNGRGVVSVAPLYYTTQQPGPDVRGLVEAVQLHLATISDRLADNEAVCTSRRSMAKALDRFLKTQQGGSHDT